jgi:hypothetical protein
MHSVATKETAEDTVPDTLLFSLPLELTVTDPKVLAELIAKQEGRERDDYALGALRLGVLALRQARGQVDVNALKHEGERQQVAAGRCGGLLLVVFVHLVSYSTFLCSCEVTGTWSQPSFISLTGGSFGWQIGVQSTDVILVFKNRKSVQTLLSGKLTLGADAAVTAGPVGPRTTRTPQRSSCVRH